MQVALAAAARRSRGVVLEAAASAWPLSSPDRSTQDQPSTSSSAAPTGPVWRAAHGRAPATLSRDLIASSLLSTRGMAFWSAKPKPTPPPPAELSFSDEPGVSSSASDAGQGQGQPVALDSSPLSLGDSDSSGGLADAVTSITDAVSHSEAASILVAQSESALFGGSFIRALELAHDSMGLPWWASIALVNVATRLVALPVMLASQRSSARLMELNIHTLPLKKLQEAQRSTTDPQLSMHIQQCMGRKVHELQTTYGPQLSGLMLSTFGSMIINSIIFISIFTGVNMLTKQHLPSMVTGGTLWFPDLTVPDPLYGLPVICTFTTLAMIQYGMNVTGDQIQTMERAEQTRRLKNLFRILALTFIPMGSYFPSGVALLWVSNSLFSVMMGIAFRQEAVRSAVGLPSLKHLADVGAKLQELGAKDAMSFVPPMAGQAPPPPAGWQEPEQPKQ